MKPGSEAIPARRVIGPTCTLAEVARWEESEGRPGNT